MDDAELSVLQQALQLLVGHEQLRALPMARLLALSPDAALCLQGTAA